MFDPRKDKVNLELISNTLYEEYKSYKFLPISRSSNNTVSIITSNVSTKLFDLLGSLYKSYKVIIASPDDMAWLLRKRFQKRDLHNSSNQLHESTPQASAKVVISNRAAIIWLLVIASLMFIADANTIIILGITALLLCHFLKIYLVFSSLEFSYEFMMDLSKLNNVEEENLPPYSIIVALYKEKEIIPQLIKSLSQLDYPQEKLDIKIGY